MTGRRAVRRLAGVLGVLLAVGAVAAAAGQDDPPLFRFRSGVELINITATVTDVRGRFVGGLDQDDFLVYEDGELQTVTHFSRERVPVSLGIVLDTSDSMTGEKMDAARAALDRFLFDLLGDEDEMFLYSFSYTPRLVHEWTSDRHRLRRALGDIRPRGGTALYDAVADAVAMAEEGRHRKKAVVIISDGLDTNSELDGTELRRRIRQSEVIVYAIGIDGSRRARSGSSRSPIRIPFPIPGLPRNIPVPTRRGDDGVDVSALRDITDGSGGRTEIIRTARDLDRATAGVADELSRQYYLGYPAPGHRDGRWHSIEVEVRHSRHRVRARRGYVASR